MARKKQQVLTPAVGISTEPRRSQRVRKIRCLSVESYCRELGGSKQCQVTQRKQRNVVTSDKIKRSTPVLSSGDTVTGKLSRTTASKVFSTSKRKSFANISSRKSKNPKLSSLGERANLSLVTKSSISVPPEKNKRQNLTPQDESAKLSLTNDVNCLPSASSVVERIFTGGSKLSQAIRKADKIEDLEQTFLLNLTPTKPKKTDPLVRLAKWFSKEDSPLRSSQEPTTRPVTSYSSRKTIVIEIVDDDCPVAALPEIMYVPRRSASRPPRSASKSLSQKVGSVSSSFGAFSTSSSCPAALSTPVQKETPSRGMRSMVLSSQLSTSDCSADSWHSAVETTQNRSIFPSLGAGNSGAESVYPSPIQSNGNEDSALLADDGTGNQNESEGPVPEPSLELCNSHSDFLDGPIKPAVQNMESSVAAASCAPMTEISADDEFDELNCSRNSQTENMHNETFTLDPGSNSPIVTILRYNRKEHKLQVKRADGQIVIVPYCKMKENASYRNLLLEFLDKSVSKQNSIIATAPKT